MLGGFRWFRVFVVVLGWFLVFLVDLGGFECLC